MAGVAFTTQGNVGTSTKQDGGALLRIGEALYGLVASLISSLEEFRDVGNKLELEIAAAGVVDGSPDESQTNMSAEVRPELLLVVASALEEMVRTVVSDIKGNADVQKLLPAIQKSCGSNEHGFHDLFQDPTISEQPPDDLARRAAAMGRRICKHSCEDHPEVVDPELWTKLPEELLEVVFAKLPLPHIIRLRESSRAWSAMSKSSIFKEACSEAHPKLCGLVTFLDNDRELRSPDSRIHGIDFVSPRLEYTISNLRSGLGSNWLVFLEVMALATRNTIVTCTFAFSTVVMED